MNDQPPQPPPNGVPPQSPGPQSASPQSDGGQFASGQQANGAPPPPYPPQPPPYGPGQPPPGQPPSQQPPPPPGAAGLPVAWNPYAGTGYGQQGYGGPPQPPALAPYSPGQGGYAPVPALYSSQPSYLAPTAPPTSEDDLHLKDYLLVVWRHRWLVAGVAIFVFLLSAVQTFRQTPVYEASATLRIEQTAPRILSGVEDLELSRGDRLRFYDTQYKLLRQRSLAERTIESLELTGDFVDSARTAQPGTLARLTTWARGVLGTRAAGPSELPAELRGRQQGVDWFLRNLMIRPEPNSELVHLVFTSPDPELASRLLNQLSRLFIEDNIADRSKAYRYAAEFVEAELSASQSRMEEVEAEMREYSGGRDQLALEKRREIAGQRLAELTTALSESEREVLQQKALLDQANEDPASSPLARDNAALRELATRESSEEAELNRLASEYGEKYPPLQQARRSLQNTREQLAEAYESVKAGAATAYNLSLANYETLKKTYEDQRRLVTELEDSLDDYRIMATQLESERQTYQQLLDRSKEINIQRGLAVNNVRLVEPAEAPLSPTYPRIGRNLMLGAVAGLLLGIVGSFFAEYMDRSIKSPDEIERFVGVPCLATIPNLGGSLFQAPDGSRRHTGLLSALAPANPLVESFRYLRTSIIYSMAGEVPRVIMFGSAQPSEGKTSVTVNTASVFAQRGARVLVIDGDLKRPACHKVFGVERQLGLTAYLTGQAELEDCIVPTVAAGVEFLPSGPIAPNPADLLDSPRMRELMQQLRGRYDHIFIDSAPLAGMADGFVQASLADGVILVVEGGRTPRELVRRIRQHLQSVNARVLGAVMNARRLHKRRSGGPSYTYNYRYNYSYDYGRRPEMEGAAKSSSAMMPAVTSSPQQPPRAMPGEQSSVANGNGSDSARPQSPQAAQGSARAPGHEPPRA